MTTASVSGAVLAELERLGATESVEGRIALRLAAQLDDPHNGMAVAGDSKELRAVITFLRELDPVAADSVDSAQDEVAATLRIVQGDAG